MEDVNETILNCFFYYYVNYFICVFFNGKIFFKIGICELLFFMYFNGKVGWVLFKII